jgi:hypothetical protein
MALPRAQGIMQTLDDRLAREKAAQDARAAAVAHLQKSGAGHYDEPSLLARRQSGTPAGDNTMEWLAAARARTAPHSPGSAAAAAPQAATTAAVRSAGVAEWSPVVDPSSGHTYYYEAATGRTQWEVPPALAVAPRGSGQVPSGATAGTLGAVSTRDLPPALRDKLMSRGIIKPADAGSVHAPSSSGATAFTGRAASGGSESATGPVSGAAPLPAGWYAATDPSTSGTYYYTAAGETQWIPPGPHQAIMERPAASRAVNASQGQVQPSYGTGPSGSRAAHGHRGSMVSGGNSSALGPDASSGSAASFAAGGRPARPYSQRHPPQYHPRGGGAGRGGPRKRLHPGAGGGPGGVDPLDPTGTGGRWSDGLEVGKAGEGGAASGARATDRSLTGEVIGGRSLPSPGDILRMNAAAAADVAGPRAGAAVGNDARLMQVPAGSGHGEADVLRGPAAKRQRL